MIKKILLFNLPLRIKGYCMATPEGEKIFVLNSRYTFEANQETFLHELSHNQDVGELNVDRLEFLRHRC